MYCGGAQARSGPVGYTHSPRLGPARPRGISNELTQWRRVGWNIDKTWLGLSLPDVRLQRAARPLSHEIFG